MEDDTERTVTPKLRFPDFRKVLAWDTVHGNERFAPIDRRPAAVGLPVLAITQEHGAIPRDLINYHVSVSDESIANYKEVQREDFIISLRSFQGGIEYSRYHGICSPAYLVLKRQGKGSDHFYRHLFKSERFIQQLTWNIEGLRDGKMISYKQFSEQLLPEPSLAEQQKIADCLTSLDEVIAAQGRKVEALKAHKKGLMQQLFPREGETLPRLRFPEFRDAGKWETKKLGDIFETATGGTPERTVKAYWDGGIPWVTTSLVDFNVITETEETISDEGLQHSAAKIFPKSTILMALYGQGTTRGKVAMLAIEAATNQACAAILPTDAVDQTFAFLNLAGRYGEIRALSNAGGQENLSQGLLRELPFAFPKESAEQQRIADCLSALDARIAAEAEKLAALKTHKKGLMQQLFPAAARD